MSPTRKGQVLFVGCLVGYGVGLYVQRAWIERNIRVEREYIDQQVALRVQLAREQRKSNQGEGDITFKQ
ncbi:hypothetical protein BASA81_003082 [Batrachochytrium salamandrivorans]|nr:hypothetical protein BASA81_003082 [Batrachochytrium salamandrivorans]